MGSKEIMSHNHRIIASDHPDGGQLLSICEVWYDEEGNPTGHNEPMPVDALTIADLSSLVRSMQRAFELPILRENEFERDEVAIVTLVVIDGGALAAVG
jgi:hypothetical protein